MSACPSAARRVASAPASACPPGTAARPSPTCRGWTARWSCSGARRRDFSIEVDPREADVFTLRHLQALGFNRLSLGVQELDLRVQRAVNRVQPRVLTESLVDEAERLGFHSLNLDLIVGLPLQTPRGFGETLDQVIAMAPARITLHRYTHLPHRYRPQQEIRAEDLPDAASRLAILGEARERLEAAGYLHIGLGSLPAPMTAWPRPWPGDAWPGTPRATRPIPPWASRAPGWPATAGEA